MTAGQITQNALKELGYMGYNVWRQNNHATRGRVFTGRKGVPDIIGFAKDGRFVAAEVKAGKDKLSPEQIELLNEAHRAGAIVFVAKEKGLVKWDEILKLIK
jgi:hypothetical protein